VYGLVWLLPIQTLKSSLQWSMLTAKKWKNRPRFAVLSVSCILHTDSLCSVFFPALCFFIVTCIMYCMLCIFLNLVKLQLKFSVLGVLYPYHFTDGVKFGME